MARMIAFLTALDMPLLQYLYSIRTLPTTYFFIGVSEIGSTVTIIGLTFIVALYLTIKRRVIDALAFLFAVGGSEAIVFALKHSIERARPDTYYWPYIESGYSFPSGHATAAMAFYGFLAYYIYSGASSPTTRRVVIAIAGILIALIGFSRLYLGVHYLSDVLAGYAIGLGMVLVGIKIRSMIQSSRYQIPLLHSRR